MKLLNQYIFRNVVVMTLAVLIVLLSLDSFITFVDQQGDVGRGSYGQIDALLYSVLFMPTFLVEVFPIATLLGSLIGMGILADHGELTAMRAAGVSVSRIIFSIIRAGLALLIIVLLIGEFVAPKAEQFAKSQRSEKMHNQVVMQTSTGFWLKDKNTFVRIETVLPGNILNNISIYNLSENNELQSFEKADSAIYEGDKWRLDDISQIQLQDSHLSIQRIDNRIWDSTISPSLLSAVSLKPGSLSIRELLRYMSFLDNSGQTSKPLEVALWSKLSVPFVTIVMLMLAVPLLFGSMRTTGIGQRIFVGAIIGVGFFLLNRTFSFLALAFDLNTPLVVMFPVIILGVIGSLLIYRIH